jgi:hypothetical protein
MNGLHAIPPMFSTRFHQLLRQIFSSDSVLQLVSVKAIGPLSSYAEGGEADPRLGALVPALGMIFKNINGSAGLNDGAELNDGAGSTAIESQLRVLCWLMADRAKTVYETIVNQRKTQIVSDSDSPPEDGHTLREWERTGCYYGQTPRRFRPFYEGRNVEKSVNMNDEGSRRKFYSTYGKKTLTGGLMALWCPHLVCVGFHLMPKAEGRNDVFSAIFKHWSEAPKVVVYDFACQLGPYCMIHEPEFFKDTLFVIDELHAKGHTNCSQACYISNYMQVQPAIGSINSSAAECSNSGLKRIRKSVSYMDQNHAFMFTYVYLSVWNRKREREFKREGQKRLDRL